MQQIIDTLIKTRKELDYANAVAKLAGRREDGNIVKAFIKDCDLHELKWLLMDIADRQSELTGCCGGIEDAIHDVKLCLGEIA